MPSYKIGIIARPAVLRNCVGSDTFLVLIPPLRSAADTTQSLPEVDLAMASCP